MQYSFNNNVLIQNTNGSVKFYESFKGIPNYKSFQNQTIITKLPLCNKQIFSCLKKPIDGIIVTESEITQLIIKKCKLKRVVWLFDINLIYELSINKKYYSLKKIKEIYCKLKSNFIIKSEFKTYQRESWLLTMLKKSAKPKKRYILVETTLQTFKQELKKIYLMQKTYSNYSYSNSKIIDIKLGNLYIVKCKLQQYNYFRLILNLLPVTKTIASSGTIKKLREIVKSLNI